MQNWRTKKLKGLMQVILNLKNEAEALNFFRDLCTLDELEEMAQRWEIAQLLNKGESYRVVAKKIGVSTTTVARIAQWLEHGEGGYRAVLDKIKK